MLNWGVIGLGKIAERFVQSLENFKEATFYAGASFTEIKRKHFQELYHPQKMYSSYDELLDDPHIDMVYIAVPHAMHYEWAMQAMKKGKGVLVEKPATLSSDLTKALCQYAKDNHIFFMEAMKTRFMPMVEEIHNQIEQGAIGSIQRIENHFCYDNLVYDPHSYLFDASQGGVLYDLAIYNVASILDFIKSPVVDIQVDAEYQYGVDVHTAVELTFESGQTALLECGMNTPNDRSQVIIGDQGAIVTDPFYRPTIATVVFGEEESFSAEIPLEYDDFYPEIAAVHYALSYIKTESERMSHSDSIACIELIEAIKEKMHD